MPSLKDSNELFEELGLNLTMENAEVVGYKECRDCLSKHKDYFYDAYLEGEAVVGQEGAAWEFTEVFLNAPASNPIQFPGTSTRQDINDAFKLIIFHYESDMLLELQDEYDTGMINAVADFAREMRKARS